MVMILFALLLGSYFMYAMKNLKLFKSLRNEKAMITTQNDDEKCFQYAVPVAINY